MNDTLAKLVERLDDRVLLTAGVIPWSCPIPSFGDFELSSIATLGLNPSNREFVDENGRELVGDERRFQTLRSLGLRRWSAASGSHLSKIADSCKSYFAAKPYDTWFRRLDYLLTGAEASYYGMLGGACHLDLIPYATAAKWGELSSKQRAILLDCSGDSLGMLLRDSAVQIIVLNGRSVVDLFEAVTCVRLETQRMATWSLPRKSSPRVAGIAYSGVVSSISGVPLGREIRVLGFNHNIQSSFGVTTVVTNAIRQWLTDSYAQVSA
jgi:hypothetical protein